MKMITLMLATIKRKRFIGDAFDMTSSGALPPPTVATVRNYVPTEGSMGPR
jgi:hypothetical protein